MEEDLGLEIRVQKEKLALKRKRLAWEGEGEIIFEGKWEEKMDGKACWGRSEEVYQVVSSQFLQRSGKYYGVSTFIKIGVIYKQISILNLLL